MRSVAFDFEDLAVAIMPGKTFAVHGSAEVEYDLSDPANRFEIGRIRLELDGAGSDVLPPESPFRPAIITAIEARPDAVHAAIEADRAEFRAWRDERVAA